MKARDLHAIWAAPDNSRLTAKQQSFRLPVHVAAKLAALCDLYPSKTRTQIVGDLLAAAIDASVEGLASVKGAHIDRLTPPDDVAFDVYVEAGPLGTFKGRANHHYALLEHELGNQEPGELYPPDWTIEQDGVKRGLFVVQEEVER